MALRLAARSSQLQIRARPMLPVRCVAGRPVQDRQTEVLLYESRRDFPEAVDAAMQRCRAGAGLAAVGFLGILGVVATTLPPLTTALLGLAFTGNAYHVMNFTQGSLRSLATQHVERLSLYQPADMDAKDAAWLASSQRIALNIRCANVDRHLILTDVHGPFQGARYTGLAEDDRVPFCDIVGRLHLLDFDVTEASVTNRRLLDAVIESTKVVAEEDLQPRTTGALAQLLQPPSKKESSLSFAALKVSQLDGRQASPGISVGKPLEKVRDVGMRACRFGAVMAAGGGLLSLEKLFRKESSLATVTTTLKERHVRE